MTLERECDNCGEKVRRKYIKKINGNYFCKHCAIGIRKNHRKETLNDSPDKETIKKLTTELKNKSFYERKKQSQPPKIKGSKKKVKDRNNFFITFEEKKVWYKLLLKQGLDEDEAKERVNELVRSQNQLRNKMLKEKKSETEIKQKMAEMLEELWQG